MEIYIQLKTKNPLIGSGKVNRQYIICKPQRKKKIALKRKRKFNHWTISPKKKKQQLSNMNFHNTKVRRIFMHWNRKGYPFTIHKPKQSKTVDIGLNRALRASKKYELQTIINTIDLCHQMFISSWLKYNVKIYGIETITLGDFFKFDKYMLQKRHHSLKDAEVTSWFKECLKGETYLINKHGYVLKDRAPHLSKKLKSIWETYIRENRDLFPKVEPLTLRENNTIINCSNKAIEFAKLNKKLIDSPTIIIITINRMLNQFKTYRPKKLGYLEFDDFWAKDIPRELVRFGTVLKTDGNKVRLLDRK